MNAADIRESMAPTPARPLSRLLRIYALETRLEFLRVLRSPGFAVPTLVFPTMFYLFFGVLFAHGEHGMEQAVYALGGLATFGVIGPGLFGFGVGFALDRGLGWLTVKRASPMPPSAYLLAKVMMCMLFATLIVLILSTLAYTLAHVRLAPGQWLALLVTLVLGSAPFCAMGLAIGAWVRPQGAPAIVNAVFLPMSFMSGLWIPLQLMPTFMQKLAPALPTYHLVQLALGTIGVLNDVPVLPHVLALAGFSVAFLLIARRGYRRSTGG